MTRLDLLVDRVRRYTATQSYTDAAAFASQIGLQTQVIVDLFNEAHQSLHGLIFANAPQLFIKTETQDLTADTEAYTLPTDAFLGANVISVEYLYGSSGDYRKLEKITPHQRDTSTSGTPLFYVQHDNQILINPIPSSSLTNGLRVTYEKKLKTVDVRRGKVSSSTTTTITLSSADLADVALGATNIPEYITVVDKDGAQQQSDIAVTSYSTSTNIITVSTTLTGVSTNDYVVIGADATTHSDFPDFCENFLVYYVIHGVMELLGHPGANRAAVKVAEFGGQVADVFSDYNTDIMRIPMYDPDRIIDLET